MVLNNLKKSIKEVIDIDDTDVKKWEYERLLRMLSKKLD